MNEEPTPEEMEAMSALLRDPALWAEPSADVEDRVLAAIAAELSTIDLTSTQYEDTPSNAADPVDLKGGRVEAGPWASSPDPTPDPSHVTGPDADAGTWPSPSAGGAQVFDLGAHRSRRRLLPLAAAAAVVVAALAAMSVLSIDESAEYETVALAGSENAPGASAVAEIHHLENGDLILLHVADLPPAPEDSFYAVWVIEDDPALRVGAGSFHMRGGDGEIELWSGVSTDTYRTVSVTLQTVDDPSGPGQPVLKGTLEPD